MTKKWKTKWAVWDDLRTALNPEKKLRTAETEIYPSVMSNGAWDDFKVDQGLGSRSRDDKGVLKTHWILKIFVLQWARKLKIRVQKIVLAKILIKIFLCLILLISFSWFRSDPDFWFSPNFSFWWFRCKKCWTTLNIWYY